MSHRRRQYLVAGTVVGSVCFPPTLVALTAGWPLVLATPVVVACWIGLTVAWVRRVGGSGDTSPWPAVPESQYLGRFAGKGGLVKKEQEDAIEALDEE